MRSFLLLCFLSFFTLLTNAQEIKGILKGESGEPLAKATVTLHRAKDSALLRSTISANDGAFSFNYADSIETIIQAVSVGFNPKWITTATLKTTSFVTLTQSTKALDAIVVTAKKPVLEVKPDKLVFNVEASINATGNNGLELLQKSPGVIVDKDDNILLSGKNGVRIFIDGKPSPLAGADLAAYLRGLSSNDIEAIEIITNPSARYEAEGNAGIVNIRLKKNKNYGLNGNVTGGYGIGITPKYNGGASLNYRDKKVNYFANYSYYNNRNRSDLDFFRIQNDTSYDQKSQSTGHFSGNNLKVGADWFINSKQTLGVILNGNVGEMEFVSNSTTPIASVGIKTTDRILVATSDTRNKRKNGTVNLNYRYADTSGRELNIDADMGNFSMRGVNSTPNVYLDGDDNSEISKYTFSSVSPSNINLYSFKTDYEQNLGKGRFTTGVKVSFVLTDNDFAFYENDANDVPVLNPLRSNRFEYTEWINAAYAQYRRQWKKLGFQGGVRMEQTNSRGELTASATVNDQDVKRNYLDFFPSAGFTYQANEKNSFGLSYSRRIDRPRYQDLNPFEYQLDQLSFRKGNPFLRPQYTNIVELRHSFAQKLTSTISYSRVNDVFAQVTDTIDGNRNFIMQRNLATQDIYSLNIAYPFSVTKWWSIYANVNLYHTRYNAVFEENKVIKLNATVFNIFQQQTFRLKKGWTAELSGFFNSPSIWGGTYKTNAIWNLDAGIQKRFWQDNGTIRVSVTDIFYTMPWTGISDFGGLYIAAAGNYESRQLKVNFTWRFGNKQVKEARNRKSGIDELNQRAQ